MKLMMVPPAQAEALFDAWNEEDWIGSDVQAGLHDDTALQSSRRARTADAPWRDDDADEPVREPLRESSLRNNPCLPALAAPSFGPAL